jgi:hypothetical protein
MIRVLSWFTRTAITGIKIQENRGARNLTKGCPNFHQQIKERHFCWTLRNMVIGKNSVRLSSVAICPPIQEKDNRAPRKEEDKNNEYQEFGTN